jgi:hypothetical protein
LREELDGVMAMCVKVAKEAIAPSAEREGRHGLSDPDIDPNVADLGLVSEPAR